MHNKLIIADGAIAVTGGRNISREYFDASEIFNLLIWIFYPMAALPPKLMPLFLEFWNDELKLFSKAIIRHRQRAAIERIALSL